MRHFFTSYSFHDSFFFFFFLRLEVFFLECGYGGCFIHGDDKIASHSFIITATAAKEAFLRAQPSQPDVQDALYIYICSIRNNGGGFIFIIYIICMMMI
jgi:hypothetical protein